MPPIGLYVHVPFCAVKCPYCDFYSRPYRPAPAEEYTAAVERDLLAWEGRGLTADSLYFGGGTPSLLSPAQVGRILDAARRAFSLAGEITMEANPNTLNAARLETYAAAGVNRLSLGLQSAVPEELAALGRKHSTEQAVRAVELARAAGIGNISLDIMLGVPHQTLHSLSRTLALLETLPVSHVSAYLLKVEEATPYSSSPLLADCPDEDGMADLYLAACEGLEAMGLRQYEISNFAKPGFESRHNLKYWRCEEYLGFGPAAHSFQNGVRFANPPDLALYLASPGRGSVPTDRAGGGTVERIMLGLRLTEGIPLSLPEALPPSGRAAFFRQAGRLIAAGLMGRTGERLFLTRRGFLVSSSILASLL